MSIGTLTKKQIERGYKILTSINELLIDAMNNRGNLNVLSFVVYQRSVANGLILWL